MIKIYPGYDPLFQSLFKDLDSYRHCRIINDLLKSRLLYMLWSKTHYKKARWLLFKHIYYFLAYVRLSIMGTRGSNDIYIFSNIAVRLVPVCILNKIRRNGNKIVLYFIDSLSNENAREAYRYTKKINFDLLYSFDRRDSEHHQFVYYPTMYSKLLNTQDQAIKYDAIFIGNGKGRIKIISDILRKCVHTKFYIDLTDVGHYDLAIKDIDINVRYSYLEVLKKTLASNCILDIKSDSNQSGLSLRAYEAVVYNKKYVTNNPSILNFPYYNKKYMLYVDDWEKINEQFLLEETDVDYHYRNDFSPVNFIKDIESRLTE